MKKMMTALALVLVISLAGGRYSDAFPLGSYSYFDNGPWSADYLDFLCGGMPVSHYFR